MISDLTIEMLDHPLSGTKIVVVGRRSEGCWTSKPAHRGRQRRQRHGPVLNQLLVGGEHRPGAGGVEA
jgi:hypothetical protein